MAGSAVGSALAFDRDGADRQPANKPALMAKTTPQNQQHRSITQYLPLAVAIEPQDQPTARLLLPGALLMTVSPKLLAPFMFIDFRFPTFFQ